MKLKVFEKIQEIWKGKTSKKEQGIYFGVIIVGYTIISLISQSLFPVKYSILDFKISAQGSITSNPDGHILWNIGMIVMGLLLVPHMRYLNDGLKNSSPRFAEAINVLSITACIGFSFVGLFPREYPWLHSIPAAIALYGFYFSLNMYLLLLIDQKKNERQTVWPKSWSFVLIFIPLNVVVIGNVLRSLLPSKLWISQIDPRIYSYPPWQWSFLISIFLTFLGIFLILPNKKNQVELKTA
ncbi:hypothetical protein [Candidatus Lokiarchaeum ossiferum]